MTIKKLCDNLVNHITNTSTQSTKTISFISFPKEKMHKYIKKKICDKLGEARSFFEQS